MLPASEFGKVAVFNEENIMAWNKPTIIEIPVSMEINMYACAKRK